MSSREVIQEAARPEAEAPPAVSVVMANYNGAAHLAEALRSVCAQTLRSLEIIVADDASTDGSAHVVRDAMRADDRIRLIESSDNGGPARARNRALDAARGEWIAIVDSDDLIHPERFDRLLRAAVHFNADIVADDLLHFSPGAVSYLLGDGPAAPFTVRPRDWIVAGSAGTPALGYVKPLLRRAVLGTARYDETLRIGEDFDLILRLLLGGARFQMLPEPWYLYRRHDASISHRLSPAAMAAMIVAQRAVVEKLGPFEAALADAFAQRLSNYERALGYELFLAALKSRKVGRAAGMAVQKPALLVRLAVSAREGLVRRLRRPPPKVGATTALYLTDKPASGALLEGQSGFLAETVPPYPASDTTDWGTHRTLWKRLAATVVGRDATVACDGPAGQYAAGFLPGVRIVPAALTTPAVQPAEPLLPGGFQGLAPEGR